MKLRDSLFKIEHETILDGMNVCTISLDHQHVIYKGHFPGYPLTPGVIQIQILEELVERKLGEKCNLISIQQSKFLKVINPKETPQIDVHYSFSKLENGLKVISKFIQDDGIYFKFSGLFNAGMTY